MLERVVSEVGGCEAGAETLGRHGADNAYQLSLRLGKLGARMSVPVIDMPTGKPLRRAMVFPLCLGRFVLLAVLPAGAGKAETHVRCFIHPETGYKQSSAPVSASS